MTITKDTPWRHAGAVPFAIWQKRINDAGGLAEAAGYDVWVTCGDDSALMLEMLGAESSYLHVSPYLPANDQRYENVTNTVLTCECAISGFVRSRNMPFPYLPNLIGSQFGAALPLTFQLPPLCDHVGGIASRSVQEQVTHPNTCRVIAPMADVLAVRDRPILNRPYKTGSASWFAPDREDAVSAFVGATRPLPALSRLVDKPGKAGQNRSGVRRVLVGDEAGMATVKAVPACNVMRLRRKPRTAIPADALNSRKLLGHFIDLLHRSVGCRARSVDALPGFCIPKLYQRSAHVC